MGIQRRGLVHPVRRYPMKKTRILVATAIVAVAALGIGTVAAANGRGGHARFNDQLTGYQETPALSTTGNGSFRAWVDDSDQEIHHQLTFSGRRRAGHERRRVRRTGACDARRRDVRERAKRGLPGRRDPRAARRRPPPRLTRLTDVGEMLRARRAPPPSGFSPIVDRRRLLSDLPASWHPGTSFASIT